MYGESRTSNIIEARALCYRLDGTAPPPFPPFKTPSTVFHLPEPTLLHNRAVISLLPLTNPLAPPAPPGSTAHNAVTGDLCAFSSDVTCRWGEEGLLCVGLGWVALCWLGWVWVKAGLVRFGGLVSAWLGRAGLVRGGVGLPRSSHRISRGAGKESGLAQQAPPAHAPWCPEHAAG